MDLFSDVPAVLYGFQVLEPTAPVGIIKILWKYVSFRCSSHFCPPTPVFRSVKIQRFYTQLRVSNADLVTRHLHSPSPGLQVATKWSDHPSDPQLDIKKRPRRTNNCPHSTLDSAETGLCPRAKQPSSRHTKDQGTSLLRWRGRRLRRRRLQSGHPTGAVLD